MPVQLAPVRVYIEGRSESASSARRTRVPQRTVASQAGDHQMETQGHTAFPTAQALGRISLKGWKRQVLRPREADRVSYCDGLGHVGGLSLS